MLQKMKVVLCCCTLLVFLAVQTSVAEDVKENIPAFDPLADGVLMAADAYMKAQQSLTLKAEVLRDIVTDEGQIITSTMQLDLSMKRPDKIYMKRVGGIRNQEIFYNGSQLVLHSLAHNVYAKTEVPSTIKEMIAFVTSRLGIQVSGTSLLSSNLFDDLMSDMVSGVYLGKVVVDGVECYHLAYRGNEVDFQIWIEAGDNAKPKRFLIVSKELPSAPRYLVNILSLEPAKLSSDTFEFIPADGEQRIRFLTAKESEQVKKAVKESK